MREEVKAVNIPYSGLHLVYDRIKCELSFIRWEAMNGLEIGPAQFSTNLVGLVVKFGSKNKALFIHLESRLLTYFSHTLNCVEDEM